VCTQNCNSFLARVLDYDGDPSISLKLDHLVGREYYCQIQLTLYCTDLPYAHLYVWAPSFNYTLRVNANEEWVKKSLPILKEFWSRYVKPRLQNRIKLQARLKEEVATRKRQKEDEVQESSKKKKVL
jgi:hypothetical protein